MPPAKLLHDYLRLTAQRLGDKEALICGDRRWTYSQIDAQSDRLASALPGMGFARADRVAVFLDNSAETVISLYGISKASGVFVIVNASLKAGKLAYILKDSQAALLVTHISKAAVVQEAIKLLDRELCIVWASPSGDTIPPLTGTSRVFAWNSVVTGMADSADAANSIAPADERDLAALIYTSGSTGRPKGVMQPHNKMIAVAKCITEYLANTEDDIILNVLSLAFGYGMYQVLMAFMFGGTVVLERSFLYLHKVLGRIAEERVTAFPFVPTVVAMMLRLEEIEQYDFSTLRYVTNAGAALPVKHTRQIRRLWPHVRLYCMYGLTECVRTSYLDPSLVDARPDSVGKALSVCETDIVDPDGRTVGLGETGELIIRGANVMEGYWRDQDLTSEVFRKNGADGRTWLYSGDLFRRDEEGFLYFVSRKDDMIKTRGERVSPAEVEGFLLDLDGVAEAAAVGVPDEIFGQVIRAFIVCRQPGLLTERDVLKYSARCMENYMVPKQITFVDQLPKTPNGKLDRKPLRNFQES